MSEKLLKATLRLFALLTMIDGVEEDERRQIRHFLYSRLNRETAEDFLALFEQHLAEYRGANRSRNLEHIQSICRMINADLTLQQKMFLILELLQLIYADQYISAGEEAAILLIGRELNIAPVDVARIRTFVTASTLEEFSSPDILIIKSEDAGIPAECKRLITGDMEGFVAVLHNDSIKPFFVRYLGHSELFINHIPLEYGTIEIFATGSTLRSAGNAVLYFSDLLSRFNRQVSELRLSFRADAVTYRFKNGDYGVREVNVRGHQGQMIGIMGGSGSGKSTLFNVLNGSARPSAGHVYINGIDIHRHGEKAKGLIGYVPQDDLLIEDLTVYENLFYAARLSFSSYDRDQLASLVEDTLLNLGLYGARHLHVGSPLHNTISGGQRKRLNMGLELLREPAILFVDEPTSGLSSRDSENIMDLLKELSLKGKLIFVIIHQPSSGIFKMFDQLLILDIGGYPIYYGSPLDAVVYFREATQLLERHDGACPECGNINPEQIFDIVENKVVDEFGRETDQRKTTPETWNELYKKRIVVHEDPEPEQNIDLDNVLEIPGRIRQTLIFMARDIKAKLNNRQYLAINFLEAPLLAVILAVLVRYHAEDALRPAQYVFQENMNITAYIFMGIVVALFMGLTVSAEEIIRDRKILKREAFLNLSRGSFLGSKITMLLVLSAIQTLSFVLVGNTILAIKGMLLPYWMVLFSVSFFANTVGLNISSAFNSVVTIYILIPILLIPQILLSGVVVQFDQLNPAFSARTRVPLIGDAMASRWAYEALMVTQYKDNAYNAYFYPVDRRIAITEYKTVYYIPRLEGILDFVFVNQGGKDGGTSKLVTRHMDVLQNEFEVCLQEVGFDKWPGYRGFHLPLDSIQHKEAKLFLNKLDKMYLTRQQEARREKEAMIQEIVNAPGGFERYRQWRRDHSNNQVADLVQDSREKIRILEHQGRLVQRIYPIYMDPEPQHFLDFGAPFYTPKKHFAGLYFDTLYFNIAVVWVMSAVLIILLYFDVFRKLLNRRREQV